MRRTAILLAAALLLIPVVVLAQDTISEAVELIFTDGGAQVGITDTIQSVAAVTVEVDGRQYLLKVPVTIDIDTAVPLTSSLVSIPAAAQVGPLGVEILEAAEYTEETEITLPGTWGETKDVAPAEGNKLIAIDFSITNMGTDEDSLSSYNTKGVDDTGRLFEEKEFSCEEINPGGNGRCAIVFDVPSDVNIASLDIEVTDHRQIAIPQ